MAIILRWRKFRARASDGTDHWVSPPAPNSDHQLLHEQIQSMSRLDRTPISFDEACDLHMRALHELAVDESVSKTQYDEFHANFVSWISSKGFWISLRGDEYGEMEVTSIEESLPTLDLESLESCLKVGLALWEGLSSRWPREFEELVSTVPPCEYRHFWLSILMSTDRQVTADAILGQIKPDAGASSKRKLVAYASLQQLSGPIAAGAPARDYFVHLGQLKRVL